MDTSNWDSMLRQTADDAKLSTGERKALRSKLREAALNDRTRGVLRSRAFALAREHLGATGDGRIIDWLKDVNKLLLPSTDEGEETFIDARFSPGDACVQRIVALLGSCRRSADICVFTITDNRITQAILAAHAKRVTLRVVTDNEKAFDRGSDAFRLAKAGIPVRVDDSPYHMHHKFAIFDAKLVLTGSYNWTRSAAQKNEENLVVSNDRRLLDSFTGEFEKLWAKFASTPLRA